MAQSTSRFTGWLIRHEKRIRTIGTGLFLYACFNFFYDYVFYTFAIFRWGVVWGGFIAASGSFFQNTIMFWLYDRMRIDWLGAYACQQLEKKRNKNRLQHFAVWIGSDKKTLRDKLSGAFIFAFLAIVIDPFIVAVYFKRRHFEGLTSRDWGVLLGAVTLANTWWILRTGLGLAILFLAWKFLF